MKLILIVLLVAAIGGGAYYFITKQKSKQDKPTELIVGKWKIDSIDHSKSNDSSLALALLVTDSNLHLYQFDIDKDGLIVQSLNGKTEDSSHYKLENDKEVLVWSKTDSAKTKWTINKLDSASFVVQDKDSTVFSFQRIGK